MANNNGTMDIDYSKLNIENCFKSRYVIPEYQREYVWQEEDVEQLMADLLSAYYENPTKGYFVGMLVVYRRDDGILEVIDGQQRLTTFFIILCALIHRYEADGEKVDVFNIIRCYCNMLCNI